MKKLSRDFLVGLLLLLPLILSVQFIIWTLTIIEGWLKSVWMVILPEQLYFPGLALIVFIVLSTILGLTSRNSLAKKFWKLQNLLVGKIPVLNIIYTTIKDFFDLMGGKTFTNQSVVWVTLPQSKAKLLGIVTKQGDDKSSRLSDLIADDEVAVYLPMSYQAGGYMLVLPSDAVEKADIEPGEALSLIMTAGLGQRRLKVEDI